MRNPIQITGLMFLILILMASLLFYACVDTLDSDYTVDAPILVVEASVLDTLMVGMPESATMQVSLFSLIPLESTYVQGGLENFGITDATVIIRDTDNNSYDLNHIGKGLYVNSTIGKAGVGYQIDITLKNGSTITSDIEYLEASAIKQDSLSVTSIQTENTQTTDIETLVHYSNPASAEAQFIYKSWREYEFREDPSLPFQKFCYISEPIDNNTVTISQVRSDQAIATTTASTLGYDSRFAFKLFYHLYQYHISSTTYAYYEQVDQNKNQSEALFAPIPGKIRTNLTLDGEDTRDLQGYFTVASVEYNRVQTNPTTLNQQVIFACPSNSSRPWSNNPLRDFCADCLIYDNATLDRPSYW